MVHCNVFSFKLAVKICELTITYHSLTDRLQWRGERRNNIPPLTPPPPSQSLRKWNSSLKLLTMHPPAYVLLMFLVSWHSALPMWCTIRPQQPKRQPAVQLGAVQQLNRRDRAGDIAVSVKWGNPSSAAYKQWYDREGPLLETEWLRRRSQLRAVVNDMAQSSWPVGEGLTQATGQFKSPPTPRHPSYKHSTLFCTKELDENVAWLYH